jgi:hypothetical protein
MLNLYRLLLVTTCALACAFAPVPPPKSGIAEAVLNAYGGPDQVRHTLEAMLPAAVQSEKVRRLACLKGEKAPAEWVRKRLRVEEVAPKGPVRVRLEGGRSNETLALLTALVDAYEAHGRVFRDKELQERVAVRLWLAQGVNAGVVCFEETPRRPGEPAVLQRPKLISTGTSR